MANLGRNYILIVCLSSIVFIFTLLLLMNLSRQAWQDTTPLAFSHREYIVKADNVFRYDRDMPLIFVGGMSRSGTTLMRAMLDAHPHVRCGQETRVIPDLLNISRRWRVGYDKAILDEAGINEEVLKSAIAAFCLEVITKHDDPAPRLCNKDPVTLQYAGYLAEIFPASKFILMIRDGRAVIHSLISRNLIIPGYNYSSYRQSMTRWNTKITSIYLQCQQVGPKRCMMVHYELLVLHPREYMHQILEFLDVPWDDSVLHHEDHINIPGGVSLSKMEWSADQVIKPINIEALSKWVGKIPEDVVKDMGKIAPMLAELGYDPDANPPIYGSPEFFVVDNTRRIREKVSS